MWTVEVGLKDVTQENLENGNIYILETHVGNTQVPLSPFVYGNDGDTSPDYETPSKPTYVDEDNYSVYQYETDHHRYEATYSKINLSGQDIFVVNNRRLGTVDLTAAKVWQDGTGTLREAFTNVGITSYLELSFADNNGPDGAKIEDDNNGHGYVYLGSTETPIYSDSKKTHVSYRQKITAGQDEYTFFNLPKYDLTGAVVHYEINEVWYNKDGKEIASTADGNYREELIKAVGNQYKGDLKKLLDAYSVSIQEKYVADPDTGTGIQNDEQTVTVTNRLGDTKTVSWTKHWKDDYTFNQSQRPDIYLDIYRVTYDKDGAVRSAKLYRHDYLWKPQQTSPTEDEDGNITYTMTPTTGP